MVERRFWDLVVKSGKVVFSTLRKRFRIGFFVN